MTGAYEALPKLAHEHDCAEFDSGASELDEWLRQRALKGQASGNATTFLVERDRRVFGFYALASGSVEHGAEPGAVRRNAPDPIPVLLLARLAVDQRAQGRGVGRRQIQDALLRSIHVSQHVGFRALLVHCRDEVAHDFYVHHVPAFLPSPTEELHLMLPLQRLREFAVE